MGMQGREEGRPKEHAWVSSYRRLKVGLMGISRWDCASQPQEPYGSHASPGWSVEQPRSVMDEQPNAPWIETILALLPRLNPQPSTPLPRDTAPQRHPPPRDTPPSRDSPPPWTPPPPPP